MLLLRSASSRSLLWKLLDRGTLEILQYSVWLRCYMFCRNIFDDWKIHC
jgi:hypothetical protein